MCKANGDPQISDCLGFDLESAVAASRAGKIEDWVHEYLQSGYWANEGLFSGLKRCRRWWAGPVKLQAKELLRKVGPEKGMEYLVSMQHWEHVTGRMAEGMQDLESLPPLIAEYVSGDVWVCDGNTRLGAMELNGWENCWVIIWYNSETDFSTHQSRLQGPGFS